MAQRPAIIVPLYIYPFPGAWNPLYEAISSYPNVDFVVIVNPHDGPGISDPFDANYAREIPRLNALSTVTTLGYVKTSWGDRPLSEVETDIKAYAGWAKNFETSGLGVKGIFFDETPNLYDAKKAAYLKDIDQTVKKAQGIQGQRQIIHNPGTVPDTGFTHPGPDATAIFEASFKDYRSHAVQQRITDLLRYRADRCAWLVYCVPEKEIKKLAVELRSRGRYIFATSLCNDVYVHFGPSWKEFVAAVASK